MLGGPHEDGPEGTEDGCILRAEPRRWRSNRIKTHHVLLLQRNLVQDIWGGALSVRECRDGVKRPYHNSQGCVETTIDRIGSARWLLSKL